MCCPFHALRPDLATAPCDGNEIPDPPVQPDDAEYEAHCIAAQDVQTDRPTWTPALERMARWGVG